MFVLMNDDAQQAAEILSYREREPALPIVRLWSLRPVPGMRFRLSSGQSLQGLSSTTFKSSSFYG